MWVVKDNTSKQTQRQPGGREGSQVGMGSALSGVPVYVLHWSDSGCFKPKHVALM